MAPSNPIPAVNWAQGVPASEVGVVAVLPSGFKLPASMSVEEMCNLSLLAWVILPKTSLGRRKWGEELGLNRRQYCKVPRR
ncbi:hypothetical protein EON65_16445 [archaeon]|nr:MAG: hypothetical protein EON65_16445 [archaeon]